MARRLTATQGKATIFRLLSEVAAGEEIEITKHGRTVAKLVPATGPAALKGIFSGTAVTTDESDELFITGLAWDVA